MSEEIFESAQIARERLSEEIERVRAGVEEMIDHGFGQEVDPAGESVEAIRAELADLRLETRDYVKRKIRKSEKRLKRTVEEIRARADELEIRIDQVEADREEAEVRIHNDTEEMLDGLLDEVRSIADRIEEAPAPAPARPQLVPFGQVGPLPARRAG